MENTERLGFRGGSFFALVPFAIFITVTIVSSFVAAADLNVMIGAGVVGLLIGMMFATDVGQYWDAVLTGLGSKIGMTAVMLWLVVGIYGQILKSGHIVEGLVWLGVKLDISGAAFTMSGFAFASLFGLATGAGFGTISTMSYILYPAGGLLGSNPAVLAGAIMSGAAFGNTLSPVSDISIIAATTQEYSTREGTAEIGGTVRFRAVRIMLAFAMSLVLYYVFGSSGTALDSCQAAELLAQYQMPAGLLLLIPTAILILLSICGKNIFACLGIGIAMAVLIGIPAGLLSLSDLLCIRNGTFSGAIPDGVAGMTTVSVLLLIVVSMGELLIRSGCMETTVEWINGHLVHSPREAELSVFALSTLFSILIAAINTIASICVGPFVNAIGRRNRIHPYRRAEIQADTMCAFPFIAPFGSCIMLLMVGLSDMHATYPFLPDLHSSDMFFTAFYPWTIWSVTLLSCLTGIGSSFEGESGKLLRR